tara:strand:+ start:269 stop:778 length:510 start_codon:yes stop_codon:yes gene_type:complete
VISNFWYRIFYGFQFYYNVFTDQEKETILDDAKFYLQAFDQNSPGLMSHPHLHEDVDLSKLFDKCGATDVNQSWLNYAKKGFPKNHSWHTHPYRYTGVYYFDDCENTMFKGMKKIFQIDVPKNTLVVFPAHIFHSIPVVKDDSERYSLAFDFNKGNDQDVNTGWSKLST